jgi:hypothetical protein
MIFQQPIDSWISRAGSGLLIWVKLDAGKRQKRAYENGGSGIQRIRRVNKGIGIKSLYR